MGNVTLDQWRALIAVIEQGGYARAAEHLSKSQSTVSYAIGQLEEILGLALFRIQGRRAIATAAGEVLYRRARHLLAEAEAMEEAARRLGQRIEPQVRVAADMLVAGQHILEALTQFAEDYPHTRVEVLESVLSGTEDALVQKQVNMAVIPRVPAGFMGDFIYSTVLVGVAAPDHPLMQLGRSLSYEDLHHYRQMVVRDSGVHRRYSAGWQEAEQRWTLSHIQTSQAAVLRGLGYAWLPLDYVAKDLAEGRLVRLPVTAGAERVVPLYLVYAERDLAGPATRRLGEILLTELPRLAAEI